MRVDNLVTAYIEIEHLNAPQGRPAGAHRTSPGNPSGTVVRSRGRAAKRSGRHQLRRRQKAAEATAEA